ncbi:MAG: hypothetical protein ACI8WY_002615, partial [Planctomycetota bacterium]
STLQRRDRFGLGDDRSNDLGQDHDGPPLGELP